MLLMVEERGAPTARKYSTARCDGRKPGREWDAEWIRRVFGEGQRANFARRAEQRGEVEQVNKPTGFGATGFASCLHPRRNHKHGQYLENIDNLDRGWAAGKNEIAAPGAAIAVLLC